MAQFKRTDGRALMSAVMQQLTGEASYSVVDAQGFLDAGKLAMTYDTNELFSALSIVAGRMFTATRPYKAPLWIIDSINSGMFTNRIRKISFYDDKPLNSGAFNTNLKTNLAEGYDNGTNSSASTGSMWEQHYKVPLEMNFASSYTWQDCITRPLDQVKIAFRGEDEWARFWSGVLTEKANDIECEKEAFNRTTLLSRMAIAGAIGDASSAIKGLGTVVDLTAAFNSYFGTNYSGEQLRTTYLKEFTSFMVAQIQNISDQMARRGAFFHAAPVYTDADSQDHYILRHTPKSEQRMMMFKPFWNLVRTQVQSLLFNPQYLDIDTQFEAIDFWQTNSLSEADKAGINMYVTVPGWLESMITSGVTTSDTKYTFNPDYVLGAIWDKDAVMTDFQLETADTTPLEARKRYISTWYTFAKGAIGDPSENMVIFIMSANNPAPANNGGES